MVSKVHGGGGKRTRKLKHVLLDPSFNEQVHVYGRRYKYTTCTVASYG